MKFPRHSFQQRGTALMVVVALLAVMCVFILCAAQSIFSVKRELQLIEKRHLQRYEKTVAKAGGQ